MKNIFNLMKTSQYPSGSDEGTNYSPDTGAGEGGEYETESFDQLSGYDLFGTARLLSVLSQSGMSTEEMAQKTDISPDAIKDILDWYDTDPEDRDLFEPKTKRT